MLDILTSGGDVHQPILARRPPADAQDDRRYHQAPQPSESASDGIVHAQHVSHGKMANTRYVLLTWNPGPNDDEQYTPEQWLDEMVLPLQEGRPPDGDRWSIGTNWKIIEAGDMVCMFRQGVHGRGIVATGVITRGAFRDSHWNLDKTGDARYVNVAWNRALDLNQMMTIDELAREVPGFAWNKVYSSGRIVDGSPAENLASLLGQGPLPPKPKRRVASSSAQPSTTDWWNLRRWSSSPRATKLSATSSATFQSRTSVGTWKRKRRASVLHRGTGSHRTAPRVLPDAQRTPSSF